MEPYEDAGAQESQHLGKHGRSRDRQQREDITLVPNVDAFAGFGGQSRRHTFPLKAHTTAKYAFTGVSNLLNDSREFCSGTNLVARQLSHFSPSKRCSIARRQ